jgi:acetyltransferase-like isoleucine patch superfamily enzyme
VTVGDDAVIGANAVVTKDVGQAEIALGVPATSSPISSRT